MTCNMNYNPEIDNSNRPWFKSVWERYIIPITTGTLVAVITLISSPGCVKRASSSLEKKLEEPGPTKSENPDSLKEAGGDIIGKWSDVRYRFMIIEPYAPYWKNQFIFPTGRIKTEVGKSILRNWWRREESVQADSLSRLVEHYALYVAGGHGVWHLVKGYIYIPEGAESLSIDTLLSGDRLYVEPAIRSASPYVDLNRYQIVHVEGINSYRSPARNLSAQKEHAKDIVDNLINPYLAESVYSTPPSLVRGNLEFNSPIDALEGGYVELCVNEQGNVEDAKIVALYGPKRSLTQVNIDKIIERARSLKFDPALDEDGNPVESRIFLPFEIKRVFKEHSSAYPDNTAIRRPCGVVFFSPEDIVEMKQELLDMQKQLRTYVNSLPDTLFSSLDVSNLQMEDIYRIANIPAAEGPATDREYYSGVAKFLRLLDLMNIEYSVWVPVFADDESVLTVRPLFIDYKTPDSTTFHTALDSSYVSSIDGFNGYFPSPHREKDIKKYVLISSHEAGGKEDYENP